MQRDAIRSEQFFAAMSSWIALTFRDEDSILYQIYEKQDVRIFIMRIFIFYKNILKYLRTKIKHFLEIH